MIRPAHKKSALKSVYWVIYRLHCPVFENSAGILSMRCSEYNNVLKLIVFGNTFCF